MLDENVTGQLFECGNAEELKEKVEKLWKNKELQLEYQKACQKVEFDNLEIYTEKLLKLYRS